VSGTFDANRRLAEIALWVDGGARWLDRATEAARRAAPRQCRVTITLDRAELDGFVSGFQGISPGAPGAGPARPPAGPDQDPAPRTSSRQMITRV
jgi:hypothetical protein